MPTKIVSGVPPTSPSGAMVKSPRAASAEFLQQQIYRSGINNTDQCVKFDDCVAAFVFACEQASKDDRICVFGSFYTVSEILHFMKIAHSG